MSYLKNTKNNIEIFKDSLTGNVYIKNSKGRLYLVNRDEKFAKQRNLKVVYITTDGKIIIKPSDCEKRRINKKIYTERKCMSYMSDMVIKGLMKIQDKQVSKDSK